MTTLNEKAEQANGPEFRRASESVGVYRIEKLDLIEANDLTDSGQYPEHGDWLKVTRSNGVRQWLECPAGLAKELVELDVEKGDAFEIGGHTKQDSVWHFRVREADADEHDFENEAETVDWNDLSTAF